MSTSTPGDTGNNSDTTPEDVFATPPVADDITSSLRPATSGRGGLPLADLRPRCGRPRRRRVPGRHDTQQGIGLEHAGRRRVPERLPGRSSSEWRPRRGGRGSRWRRHLRDRHEGPRRYRLRQAGGRSRPSPSRRTDRPRCRCRQPERCRTYPRGRRWSCRAVRQETTRSRRRRSRRAASPVRAPGTRPDWVAPAADARHLYRSSRPVSAGGPQLHVEPAQGMGAFPSIVGRELLQRDHERFLDRVDRVRVEPRVAVEVDHGRELFVPGVAHLQVQVGRSPRVATQCLEEATDRAVLRISYGGGTIVRSSNRPSSPAWNLPRRCGSASGV